MQETTINRRTNKEIFPTLTNRFQKTQPERLVKSARVIISFNRLCTSFAYLVVVKIIRNIESL